MDAQDPGGFVLVVVRHTDGMQYGVALGGRAEVFEDAGLGVLRPFAEAPEKQRQVLYPDCLFALVHQG